MITEEYAICMMAGDTYELNIIYKDSDKVLIDLTDYEVYFQARVNQGDDEFTLDKTFIITAEQGVEGLVAFTLTSVETEELSISDYSSKYIYAIRLTDPTGTDIKTILSGTLEVTKGVI